MLYPPEFKAGELVELRKTYIAKEKRREKGRNWCAIVLEDSVPGRRDVCLLDNGRRCWVPIDYLQHLERNDEKT